MSLSLSRSFLISNNFCSGTPPSGNEMDNRAQGRGVWRSVFHLLEELILTHPQSSIWTMLEDDQVYTTRMLKPHLVPLTDDLMNYLQGVGLFIRISLLWRMPFLRLSPAFVYFLLSNNREAATAKTFLKATMPVLSGRLDTWPPPRVDPQNPYSPYDLSTTKDPLQLIMSVLDITVS